MVPIQQDVIVTTATAMRQVLIAKDSLSTSTLRICCDIHGATLFGPNSV